MKRDNTLDHQNTMATTLPVFDFKTSCFLGGWMAEPERWPDCNPLASLADRVGS